VFIQSARLRVLLLPANAPRFVGVPVPRLLLASDVELMRRILGVRSAHYEESFNSRYGDSYHVTLVNSLEYLSVDQTELDRILGEFVSVDFLGLGRHTSSLGDTFFTVCRSTDLIKIRARLGLSAHDFHATLGFDSKDVHGVPKDISTIIVRPGFQ
jgi:hypothetical protein